MSDRRLIEDSLPLAEISEQSAREKYIRKGHISTLHLWWARRPLAACRAAVYAAMVDAPKTKEERQRQHELLKKIVDWDVLEPTHPDHGLLKVAADDITKAHAARLARRKGKDSTDAHEHPRVLDPFAGGGAIPLEAQRLGCETFGNDLNPVAHVIELGSIYYPQRFAEDVVRPKKDGDLPNIDVPAEPRLAVEVERWANWVQQRVAKEIGSLYPSSGPDREALGYFWVRQVHCSNPACRVLIPVVNQTWLSNKANRKIAYRIKSNAKRTGVEYSLHYDEDIDFDPKTGTYGENKLLCPCCGEVTDGKYMRAEGMAGKIEQHLVLVCEVSTKQQGRFYRLATEADRKAWRKAEELAAKIKPVEGDVTPDRPSGNARGLSAVTRYGMSKFADFFNARQTVTLDAFARAIRATRDEIAKTGEDLAFADAVACYLALALDRIANQCSTVSRWHNSGEKIEGVYSKQAVAIVWDYVESNPIGSKTASWSGAVEWGTEVIRKNSFPNPARVLMGSATELASRFPRLDAVITDPPYYDSVPYSDISDFFYVWLRRTLGDVVPDAFSGPLTPKRREIIQHNPRHGGEAKARAFYESEMTKAFEEAGRTLADDGIIVVMFAHKTTAAWETLLTSLLAAGLVVTASWPVDTEMGARTGAQGAASLASSVFIVCRKRAAHDEGFIDDVEPALKARLHERLDYFWTQGIRGADFFMSAIGPAIEVFGTHKRVLKLSGEEVSIAELLNKVRGIVADYALQRIVQGAAAGDVDDASRFYVIWRWAFGASVVESGEAIHMAQSMGCEFSELVSDRGVLTKTGDKVTLKGPLDRKKAKGLGEPAPTGTLAPLIDVLHRAANLWAAGERQDLADFLATALLPGGIDRMQRLAQSIVDVLPPGDKERSLYENFLVGARSLPAPTKKDEAAERQRKLF
ncbi:DUF1156 domain-containing protein [Bradyrhizobium japonicum]|uniref:DUF1156 domain-containing protein n=1 Tax=Bradyrhizobium japonicum TaxID=375 RepID=UPI001E5A655B|nr:DUF1156 domain-containing protein [Bradyrhizobium japonicum]MCD9893218.1 DUF1156 domain-containing protein [Bradyrhizobium japonicum]WRJ83848.1 DUF1156 domain-containing protein [Bradyrhizobium japonicum]WRJ92830.1 DUF1156 domain-containing protein [Bradyrhizobium japonicum]WRK46670.1 DUF1156 domain-containing protein [Bradyrhizobium japonicum]